MLLRFGSRGVLQQGVLRTRELLRAGDDSNIRINLDRYVTVKGRNKFNRSFTTALPSDLFHHRFDLRVFPALNQRFRHYAWHALNLYPGSKFYESMRLSIYNTDIG